jgi:hypothetical protein
MIAGVAALGVLATTAGADCSTSGCRADVGMWGSTIPSRIKPTTSAYSLVYFTAKDNGPAPAYGIDMHITVPYGLKIVYADDYAAQGKCTIKGTFVNCYLGNFKREQLADITIKVRPRSNHTSATYEIPAHVYSQGVDDPNGGNNQGTDTLQVYSD